MRPLDSRHASSPQGEYANPVVASVAISTGWLGAGGHEMKMPAGASRIIARISREPPFRLMTRLIVKKFSRNIATRARLGVDPYAPYQYGMLEGALLARRQGQSGMTAVEFGVGSGRGFLKMEQYAAIIEAFTGAAIKVVGFDTGVGLPTLIGDYRDHPDQ